MNTNRLLRTVRWNLVAVFMLLAGCSQSGSTVIAQGEPSSTIAAADPYEGPPQIPTPGKDTGVIAGRIVSVTTESPLASHVVYLGEILPLQPGPEYLVTLQVESSPHTTTDSQGYFAFADIEPGSYPLIIWTPFKSLVIPDASGESELQVIVDAGETSDVGELKVQWP
ncbi:MAG: hypothetical protein ACC700_11365 [Anaerolineales bacterium]